MANLALEDPADFPSSSQAVASYFRHRLKTSGLSLKQTIAMLTAVPQEALRMGSCRDSATGLTVEALCTLGLGNALAPGDPTLYNEELEIGHRQVGTINLMVAVNRGLTDSALVELLTVVTQAKCVTMFRHAQLSCLSGNICLGTGTDCTAILAPTRHPVTLKYAGLHCKLAEVAARATMQATKLALAAHADHISDRNLSHTAR